MDPVLAEIYGTNQVDEADLEKLAAAELAEELADEDELNVDNIDDDTIEQLAQQVLEGGEQEYEEPGDEMSEKVAEADYMGRVMAHAYKQELDGIEKEAKYTDSEGHERYSADDLMSSREAATKGEVNRSARGVENAKNEFGKRHDATRAEHGSGRTTSANIENRVRSATSAVKRGAGHYGHAMAGGRGAKGFMERLKGVKGQRLGVHGARAGTLAALTAAGAGVHRAMSEKRASAMLDEAAEMRALEMLDEAGYDVSDMVKEAWDMPLIGKKAREARNLGRVAKHVGEEAISEAHEGSGSRSNRARIALKRGANKVLAGGKAVGRHVGRNKIPYAILAAGGGVAGATALSNRRGKKKEASALDTLAEQRALEILNENGIDPSAQEPETDQFDVLADAVEQRAVEMLDEAGYIEPTEE